MLSGRWFTSNDSLPSCFPIVIPNDRVYHFPALWMIPIMHHRFGSRFFSGVQELVLGNLASFRISPVHLVSTGRELWQNCLDLVTSSQHKEQLYWFVFLLISLFQQLALNRLMHGLSVLLASHPVFSSCDSGSLSFISHVEGKVSQRLTDVTLPPNFIGHVPGLSRGL